MSTPTLSHDSHDDASEEAAATRRQRQQKFLQEQREAFRVKAAENFTANLSSLGAIYRAALVDVVHFAPVHELVSMATIMHRLRHGELPAAYAVGGYQEGVFKLPPEETEESVKIKLIHHVLACAPYSLVLRGLAGKPTPVPWEKVALGDPELKAARRADASWDKKQLQQMAQNGEQVEELTLQGIIHGVGPWVIWFYPKPGAWLSNWLECYGFLRAFDCLPSSIRHSFSPYCFSILRIDPSKPPKPATPPPAAIPTAPSAAKN